MDYNNLENFYSTNQNPGTSTETKNTAISNFENDVFNQELKNSGLVADSSNLTLDEIAKKKEERIAKKSEELSNDSNLILGLKSAYNTVNNLWNGEDLKANYMGSQHSMQNKTFEDANATMEESLLKRQELIDQYNNAVDDPNARHKVYQLRLKEGVDENGNPIYSYKTGIAETSAAERYKNQYIKNGYEILSEKGFAGAEDWENQWHGLKSNIADRTYEEGFNKFGQNIKDVSNFGDGYTEIYNTQAFDIGKSDEEIANNKIASEQLANDAREQRLQGYGRGSSSIIDAFQAGAAKTVVDLGDTILDILTPGDNTLLNNASDQANIDKFVGYNRKDADKAIGEATGLFKQGKYASALWEVFKEPQIVAESLPMMLEMTVGFGKFTKAGKLIEDAKKYQEAGNLNKVAEINKQLAEEVTDSGKALYKVANNAGFLSAVSQQTNNDLEERIKNNQDGTGASVPETIGVFASNLALLGLDRFAFDKITGIEGGKKALGDAFALSDAEGKRKILTGIGATATDLATSGAEEAAQEYIQTWGEVLNQQLGTDKNYGEFSKIISSQENIDNAIGGMIAGAAGGIHMRQASDGVELAYNKIKGTDLKKDLEERTRYSFTPDAQYSLKPEVLKKDPGSQALEGERIINDIKRYSTQSVLDSMFKGTQILDINGNKLTPEQGLSNAIDTLRFENMSTLEAVKEKEQNDRMYAESIKNEEEKANYLENLENREFARLMANREGYIQDFTDTYKILSTRVTDPKLNIKKELSDEALGKVFNLFLEKIYSEQDPYIKDRLLSDFVNEYIDKASKETILKGNKDFLTGKDIEKDVIFGSEAKQYLDKLKDIRNVVFGSMPINVDGQNNVQNNNVLSELDNKINSFESMYNEYNEKLQELRKNNPNANLNILNAKTAEEVGREILDGSGFITNIMKPRKRSINGHMNIIRRNISKIGKDLNTAVKQNKNLEPILESINDLKNFSDSRTRNNEEAYADLIYKYNKDNAIEVANELFKRGQAFSNITNNSKSEEDSNIESYINKIRKENVPVYRMEMDYGKLKQGQSRTGEKMIEEGQAFIKNLNDTKLLLLSKIEAQSLLINDKTNKRDEAIIKSNIEKINDKIKLIDEAIETQNKNIELLQRAREVMSDPKVVTTLSNLYRESMNKQETDSRDLRAGTSVENQTNIGENNGTNRTETDERIENVEERITKTEENAGATEERPEQRRRENDVIAEEQQNVDRKTEQNEVKESGTSVEENVSEKNISEVPEIKDEITNYKEEISNINKEISRIKNSEEYIKKVNSALQEKVNKLEKLSKGFEKIQSLIESSKNKIKSLTDSISNTENEINSVNKNIEEKENLIEKLKNDNIQKQESVKKLLRSINASKKVINKTNNIKYEINKIGNKLEKLNEIKENNLSQKSIISLNEKKINLEKEANKLKYGNGSIHQLFVQLKDKEFELIKEQNNDNSLLSSFDINQIKYDIKAINRKYRNEIQAYNIIKDASLKVINNRISQYQELKDNTLLKNGLMFLTNKISELKDISHKLENYEYPNIFDISIDTIPELYTETKKDGTKYTLIQVPAYVRDYLSLDDIRKGITKFKKKPTVYSELTYGVGKLSTDEQKNRVIKNYFSLKGSSYENKINLEFPVETEERNTFDAELLQDLNYIVNSNFVDKNSIMRDASAITIKNDGKPVFGEYTQDDIKDISFEIVQGKIIGYGKNKDGEKIEIDRNLFSYNIMSLLFGNKVVDGISRPNIPSDFANSIKFESIKEIENMYDILLTSPYGSDVDKFDAIWGIDPYSENASEQREYILDEFVGKGYIPESIIVRDLGRRIYNQLPLTFDKNMIEQNTESEIITQIGIYAIGQFQNNAFVLNEDGKDVRYVISRYVDGNLNNDKIKMDLGVGREYVSGISLPLNKTVSDYIVRMSNRLSYLDVKDDRTKPSFSPIKSVPENIKHKKTKLSDTAIETIKDYQSVAYKFEDNITEMYELWKNEDTRKYAYMHAGIYEPNFENMPLADIKKAIAKNRSEMLELDSLMRFYEEAGTEREFYLPWDFVTSGRYMVSSNINPQGSKITRFLVSTKGTRTEIEIKAKDGNVSVDKEYIDGINRSLAQAFDYGLDKDLDLFVIDKMQKDSVKINENGDIEFADTSKGKLVKKAFEYFKSTMSGTFDYTDLNAVEKSSKIIEKLNQKGVNGEPEFEGFHAVQAVRELAKFSNKIEEAKEYSLINKGIETDVKYSSHFVIEADGITSGMMITLAQIMTDDAVNLMEKGGIYTKESIDFWSKIAKDLIDGGFIDKKHTDDIVKKDGSIKVTHGLLNRIGKLMSNTEVPAYLSDKGYSKEDLNRADFKDFYNTIAKGVTSKIKSMEKRLTENLVVAKSKSNNKSEVESIENDLNLIKFVGTNISRNMAKDPVMVFIYGSSLGSIKSKILHNLIKSSISKRLFEISRSNEQSNGITNLDIKIFKQVGIEVVRGQGDELLYKINSAVPTKKVSRNAGGAIELVNLDKSETGFESGFKYISINNGDKIDITSDMMKKLFVPSFNTYGQAFEDAFEDNFSFIGKYRDIIKAIEVVRFNIFDYKFKEKVENLIEERSTDSFKYNPTNEELDNILKELTDEGFGHVIKDINGGYHSFEKSELSEENRRTSLRVITNGKSDTQSGSIDIRKEVVNTGAAPVTSIHNQDGWQIRYATLKNGMQNVFDAIITGTLNHNDGVYLYNEGFGKANTMHSILQSQLVDIENIINKLGQDGINNIVSRVNEDSAYEAKDLFDKMRTNHVLTIAKQNGELHKAKGFGFKTYAESINQVKLLQSIRNDLISDSEKILNGLFTKVEDVIINHLYATDNGKQFSGTLGGFKDEKADAVKIFNLYNDIMFKMLTVTNPSDVKVWNNENIKSGFEMVVKNNLETDKKAKDSIIKKSELLLSSKGITDEQRNEIRTIINNLVNCKP